MYMIYQKNTLLGLLALTLSSSAALAGEPYSTQNASEPALSDDRSGLYIRGYGGLDWFEDTGTSVFDTGWRAGGSVGYRFGEDSLGALMVELDASYGESEVDTSKFFDGELGLATVAVNLIHDFDTGTRFRPYLGAGIGAGFLNSDITAGGRTLSEDDDAVLLYQFIGGLEVQMTERLSVFTEYRYVGLDDFSLSSGGSSFDSDDFGGHQLLFGARISF